MAGAVWDRRLGGDCLWLRGRWLGRGRPCRSHRTVRPHVSERGRAGPRQGAFTPARRSVRVRSSPGKQPRAPRPVHAAACRRSLSGRNETGRAMILLTHPFGNANVRAVLNALDHADLLAKFVTTLGWSHSSPFLQAIPENFRAQLARRAYDLPHYKIKTHPAREIVRLLAEKLEARWLTKHETGWASINKVWSCLDRVPADYLSYNHEPLNIRGFNPY